MLEVERSSPQGGLDAYNRSGPFLPEAPWSFDHKDGASLLRDLGNIQSGPDLSTRTTVNRIKLSVSRFYSGMP